MKTTGGEMNLQRFGTLMMTSILIAVLAAPLLQSATRDRNQSVGKAAPASRDSQKSIQAVLDAQIVAWNHGDIEGFMAGYWNSPDFIYIGNKQVTRGWQAMLDRYHQAFQPPNQSQMGTLELTDTQITPLDKQAALVWGTYRVTNPDGKQRGGLYTLVMRKFPEGWRTVYDRTSSEPLQN
jgi:uncharacterized protein (TIGR02246 family)